MFPVAAKPPFHNIRLLAITNRNVNQANRLLFRPTARTRNASDTQPKSRGRLPPNAFRQSPSDFLTDRPVGLDHGRRHTREKRLELHRYKPPLPRQTIASCR